MAKDAIKEPHSPHAGGWHVVADTWWLARGGSRLVVGSRSPPAVL